MILGLKNYPEFSYVWTLHFISLKLEQKKKELVIICDKRRSGLKASVSGGGGGGDGWGGQNCQIYRDLFCGLPDPSIPSLPSKSKTLKIDVIQGK